MRLIRNIPVWLLAVAMSQVGVGSALHAPSVLHSEARIGLFASCPQDHSSTPADAPDNHRDCPVCHLIAQGSVAAFAPALMVIDRADAPVQRLRVAVVEPVLEDLPTPIGARAPPVV